MNEVTGALFVAVVLLTVIGLLVALIARDRAVVRRRRESGRRSAAQDAAVAVATGHTPTRAQARLLNRHVSVVCTVLATFAGPTADRLRSVVTATTRDRLLERARWSRNPASRIGALEHLALLGKADHLDGTDIVDLLDDPDPDVVVAVAGCLLSWNARRWMPSLCDRLTVTGPTSLRIADLLVASRRELGPSLPEVILELGASVPLLRVLAATATPETGDHLHRLASEAAAPEVRAEAVYALAQLRGTAEQVLIAIRDAYHDPALEVRIAALRAAARLGVRDLTLATSGLLGDPTYRVRVAAAETLAELPAGVSTLAMLTGSSDPVVARFAIAGISGTFARRSVCQRAGDDDLRGAEIRDAFPTVARFLPALAASIVDDPALSPGARRALSARMHDGEQPGRLPPQVRRDVSR